MFLPKGRLMTSNGTRPLLSLISGGDLLFMSLAFFSWNPEFAVVYWLCPCAGRQSLSLLLQRK
ncbi:protein of unknown function [Caballeronia sp. S22]